MRCYCPYSLGCGGNSRVRNRLRMELSSKHSNEAFQRDHVVVSTGMLMWWGELERRRCFGLKQIKEGGISVKRKEKKRKEKMKDGKNSAGCKYNDGS